MENPFEESKLPKEMPEHTSMRYSENGGMAPTGYSIKISENVITVKKKEMRGASKTWYAEITKEDKKVLYKIFVENNFDLIKNEKRDGIVYDAPSEGVGITAGKISKRVSYGANSPLSKKNLLQYSTVAKALKKLAAKYKSKGKPVAENYSIIHYRKDYHEGYFKNVKATRINHLEIEKIESITKTAIKEYNATNPQRGKIKNLAGYTRQYIPVINKTGEKLVWVNYFCDVHNNWKKEIAIVFDGGNCYFNVFVNITKGTFEKFSVNSRG